MHHLGEFFYKIFSELVCKIDFCANIGRKHLYFSKWVIFGSLILQKPPILDIMQHFQVVIPCGEACSHFSEEPQPGV